ncbi:MAG: universal stress protein [Dehalococcoidales bacterium]|nr:universal stress protein [Dehalococcoidales bacterium]
MFEKILVPLDTSPFAEQVIPSVIELARSFNSEIDLINICEEHKGHDSATCQEYLENISGRIEKALEGTTIRLIKKIIAGSPSHKIISFAKEEKVALTVMSSHGISGVTLWPLGSTVDKVLRQTEQPILIVRVDGTPDYTPQEGLFKRILVPLDGSELGARVVPYVSEIASKLNSEIVLFYVIETDKRLHSLGRIDSVPIREDEMVLLKQHSREHLEKIKQKFKDSAPSVNYEIATGNVAEEIIKYSSKNKCSLIALSSHGHSGLETWIIGSVTNKILHAGRTSLLFVPALAR